MRVAILCQVVSPDAGRDELDDLEQLRTVIEALQALGHETDKVDFSLDLALVRAELEALCPDFVFNLVEAVEGRANLLHVAPALLEFLGLPYSGCPMDALFTTSHKILAKTLMRGAGLPTPDWIALGQPGLAELCRTSQTWILKSVWEHASTSVREDSLVQDPTQLMDRLKTTVRRASGPHFAEVYVPGREFNISVLGGTETPEVLPCAEIRFLDFPPDKPHILDYRAKWEEESFEYRHTVRSFEFTTDDSPLLEELRQLSIRCWELFGLRGYARVDFRVDEKGHPWILEVNANPCISEDAGFLAAAARAGLQPSTVVSRIIADTVDSVTAHVL